MTNLTELMSREREQATRRRLESELMNPDEMRGCELALKNILPRLLKHPSLPDFMRDFPELVAQAGINNILAIAPYVAAMSMGVDLSQPIVDEAQTRDALERNSWTGLGTQIGDMPYGTVGVGFTQAFTTGHPARFQLFDLREMGFTEKGNPAKMAVPLSFKWKVESLTQHVQEPHIRWDHGGGSNYGIRAKRDAIHYEFPFFLRLPSEFLGQVVPSVDFPLPSSTQ